MPASPQPGLQQLHLEGLGSQQAQNVHVALDKRSTVVQRQTAEKRLAQWLFLPFVHQELGNIYTPYLELQFLAPGLGEMFHLGRLLFAGSSHDVLAQLGTDLPTPHQQDCYRLQARNQIADHHDRLGIVEGKEPLRFPGKNTAGG